MNKLITRSLAYAGTMLLASCGTTIKIPEPVPAKMDAGRHARLYIKTSNGTGEDIKDGLSAILTNSMYYTIVEAPHPTKANTDTILTLSKAYANATCDYESYTDEDGDTHYDYHYDATAEVECLLSKPPQGSMYAVKSYSASDDNNSSSSGAIDNVIYKIVRKIAEDMVPREKYFKITVSSDRDYPLIEEGAKACKEGDWKRGRKLAELVLKENASHPEANFLMGLVERHDRNFDKSDQYFNKAISLGNKSKYTAQLQRNQTIRENNRIYMKQMFGK